MKPIRKRWALLTLLAPISAIAYAPFLAASVDNISALAQWIYFPLGNFAALSLIAAISLPIADKANVPMPFLRPWDTGAPEPRTPLSSMAAAILWCAPLAAAVAYLAGPVGMPSNPGTLTERLLTVGFAAINLQIVLLLFLGSIFFLALRSRILTAIVGGLALAAFHMAGGIDFQSAQAIYQTASNGALGAVFMWLYVRHGFEFAVLGHAISHAIAISFI